ncbi:MAG: hypothetical protein RLZZ502_932 [Pseudomonadota bacterium]|jgi:DNA-binding GntR family transcriptional regulator
MSDPSILYQLLLLAHEEAWDKGQHLVAQALANRLGVSRSPINKALAQLANDGHALHAQERGYFLARRVAKSTLTKYQQQLKKDPTQILYFQIAEDRLKGVLPDMVRESQLRQHYDCSTADMQLVLRRMSTEGWLEKKVGYGWHFTPMLTTPDSLLQTYRLRLALEPAALLEPGYHLSPEDIKRCEQAEMRLLSGGIHTATADQLHERGVRFHETLVQASGNAFFVDALRRVNHLRRLLSYRSMQDRSRYAKHCEEHLHLLALLAQQRNEEAAQCMSEHLRHTLHNLNKIRQLLD